MAESLSTYLNLSVQEKRTLLEKWNLAYRTGEALVDDETYDAIFDSLPEDDPLRLKTGFDVGDQRKCKLPFPMFSMDKVKSCEELEKWLKLKGVDGDAKLVISPKYDGLSFLIKAGSMEAYTRGNGIEGQRSDHHFKELSKNKKFKTIAELKNNFLIGEVIMKRKTFNEKYAERFRNPRNLVAGLFNQKSIDPALQDVEFIAYGLAEDVSNKSKAFDWLNRFNVYTVPYECCQVSDLDDDKLNRLFATWNEDFEIDGLIIELDELSWRQELGREKNNNPAFSRAWKGFRESSAETVIRAHTIQLSKEGRLTFVGQVDPVELDGVTVSNVTLYNAGTVLENQWGAGARVRIIRSGMVIPKIIDTLEPASATLPETCPSCQTPVHWDNTHIHLICPNTEGCDGQRIQKIIAFLSILGVEEIGEGVVEQLYKEGFDTIEKLLQLQKEELVQLDRFAERKAEIVVNNLKARTRDIPLEKLQHASGCFKGLGSKKLALVNRFDSPNKKPDFETLLEVEGFSEISARAYLEGFDRFWAFIQVLPVSIAKTKEPSGNKCEGMKFCFTGFRDKELEAKLTEEGGKVSSGVTSKTTHVVAKDMDSTSSKLKKARDLKIEIWDVEKLLKHLQA